MRPLPGLSDKYAIERELGRGGMAAVYLAEDKRHARKVALKVLDAGVAGSMGIERFLREIRIAARLSHPHIVPLYDSGESAGAVFYVMPYVIGETLRDRLARGPMAMRDVLRVAREVAGALDYAHRQGVVHRDMKPDNIMLTEGHAVITDFGVARAIAEATHASITSVGMTVGTPAYMSPEQCGGDESPLDGRCDQYAFACVLYEMITGKPPFTGSTAMSLLAQHLTATPQRLSAPEPVPATV
ncbi:MAG: serine/threonine-protein kinase, partial [Gemmatimonadaceae bacterium]